MTSGNTFLTDFFTAQREQFKRRLWPFALTALGYFLYYVVALSLVLTSYVTDGNRELAFRMEAMKEAAAGMLGPNIFIAMVTTVAAAVLSLQGFSWMHNRRTVDFYESHPVGRSRRFVRVCVNSFIIFIVSYAVSLLIGILICCGFGSFDKMIAAAALNGSLKAFALFASTFFIGVLAATLTGNTLISVLAMGTLMIYELLLRFTIELYISRFLKTVVIEEERYFTSPLYYYVTDGMGMPVAAMLLIALVSAAAAYFCYRIRKNECAGSAVIFQPVRTVVKIAISLIGGLIAWNIFNTSGSMVLSLVFMCFFIVVVGCILQIIYDSDFKALFRRGWELVIAAVAALAIVIGFKADLLGVDAWMPDPTAVEDSAVHLTTNYHYYLLDEKGKSCNTRDYAFDNMHLKDTEAVIALAQYGLDYMQRGAVFEEAHQSDSYYDITEYTVEYRMKSGRKVKRKYWLPYNLYPELMERITADEGFRSGIFQVYHDGFIRENTYRFNVWYDNGQDTKNLDGKVLTPEFYEKFREAYLTDLPRYSYKLDRGELPVGSLILQGVDNYDTMYYPVYACFENTVKVLQEAGCFLERLDIPSIAKMMRSELGAPAENTEADGYQEPEGLESMDYPDLIVDSGSWYIYEKYFSNTDAIRGLFRSLEDELHEYGLDRGLYG